MRNIAFHAKAFAEIREWAETDSKIHLKILAMLNEIARSPYRGTGKPEPLKGNLQGYWSRRITDEHRLVYQVTEEAITVMRCKGHYH
ncbi:MAG: Txe/YoeB family addiction module toxin [Candidatus Kapaibacteriota bacterium]